MSEFAGHHQAEAAGGRFAKMLKNIVTNRGLGQVVLCMAFIVPVVAGGCVNPYAQFYLGSTAESLNADAPRVAVPEGPARVVQTPRFKDEIELKLREGMVFLGESSWVGSRGFSESQARRHAQRIGASVVILSSKYVGSVGGAVGIPMPSTTTSYGSGMIGGSYGTANWMGSMTTYGTTTMVVPTVSHQYEVKSAFFGTRAADGRPMRLGVYPRPLTTGEQAAAGTVDGIGVWIVIVDSPAARAGVLPQDVICTIGDMTVNSTATLNAALDRYAGEEVELNIRRRGAVMSKTVAIAGD